MRCYAASINDKLFSTSFVSLRSTSSPQGEDLERPRGRSEPPPSGEREPTTFVNSRRGTPARWREATEGASDWSISPYVPLPSRQAVTPPPLGRLRRSNVNGTTARRVCATLAVNSSVTSTPRSRGISQAPKAVLYRVLGHIAPQAYRVSLRAKHIASS